MISLTGEGRGSRGHTGREGLRGAFRVIGEGVPVGPSTRPTNEPIIGCGTGMTWHCPKDFKIIRCQQFVGWEGINSDDLRDVM